MVNGDQDNEDAADAYRQAIGIADAAPQHELAKKVLNEQCHTVTVRQLLTRLRGQWVEILKKLNKYLIKLTAWSKHRRLHKVYGVQEVPNSSSDRP